MDLALAQRKEKVIVLSSSEQKTKPEVSLHSQTFRPTFMPTSECRKMEALKNKLRKKTELPFFLSRAPMKLFNLRSGAQMSLKACKIINKGVAPLELDRTVE